MIRPVVLIGVMFVGLLGFTLYQMKYRVKDLRADVVEYESAIEVETQEIRMLRAEWAYLNRPDALEERARSLLNMKQIDAEQLVAIDDIPFRESDTVSDASAVVSSGDAQ